MFSFSSTLAPETKDIKAQFSDKNKQYISLSKKTYIILTTAWTLLFYKLLKQLLFEISSQFFDIFNSCYTIDLTKKYASSQSPKKIDRYSLRFIKSTHCSSRYRVTNFETMGRNGTPT